ncbi:MAG: PAS domain S-box protein [bacterium]|nr:PAS domain S-box protein [bacterium]
MAKKIEPQDSFEALRDSFASFRVLAENVKDNAIYLLDREGRVATWNAGAQDLMQYTAEEIIGKHFSYFYLPDDVAAGTPAAELVRALAEGQSEQEGWRQRKDGSMFQAHVVMTPVIDSNGKHLGFGKVTRDLARDLNQEHMRSVLDHVLDGIISIDERGAIRSFNLVAEKFFGYCQSEVIGMNVRMLMPEPYHGEHDGYIGSYLRTGVAKLIGAPREVSGLRKDGSTFPMEIAVSEFNLEGRRYFTGIVRDVSERVNEESRMRAIFENTPDSIMMIDNFGIVQSVNRAGEEMTGYSANEIIGQHVSLLTPEEQRPQMVKLLDRMFSGEQSRAAGLELLSRRKDAAVFPIDLSLNEFSLGGNHFVIAVSRDATERRDREERLRAILDNASDAIITVDEDGLVLSFNRAAEGLYGYTEAEMNGQEVFILAHEEQRAYFADLVQRMCRGEQAQMRGIEGQGQRKDGSVFPLELSLNVFAFGDKHYVIGLYRDTTEQKDKAERLRAILDNASDAIITVDEDGLVLSFNRAAEGLYGYTEAEMNGQEVFILAHEEQRAYFADLVKRMCRGEQEQMRGIEGQGQRKDGSVFPLELSLNVFAFGDKHYVIGLYRDTTEQKDKAERLRAILDNASDAIITVDEAGVVLSFNRAAEGLYGYSEVEMTGNEVFKLAHQDERDFFADQIRRLCSGEQKQILGIEGQGCRKDGTSFPLELSLNVFAFGDKHYVIGLYRDATQRKKLEEQLRQSQKMEAVGKLAGGVAHDFNNMLTVINGYSGMALKKLQPDDALHEYITEILHAGERAALITSQLLAFSRQLVLAPRVLDLNRVVVETEKMLQRLIGEDISVAATLDPRLDRIRVDQGQIVQVIMNLAVNARDAMPQGGKLTIKTSNFYLEEERAIEMPELTPGHHVVLTVSDSGIGMSKEVRDRIFEPFFTTKPPGEGTGLGLATVYGIITQSGGSIDVYSEVGHGTSFMIYFPAIEEDAELHQKPEIVVSRGGTETILLVEDDSQVRRVALVLLQEQGYTVLVANGGGEAVELARHHPGHIDLLLTDLIMPEMSGRQVAEAIVPLLPDVKVLYMSGYTDDAVVRHGLVTDSVSFLQKPFTSTSLPAKVRQVLDSPATLRIPVVASGD